MFRCFQWVFRRTGRSVRYGNRFNKYSEADGCVFEGVGAVIPKGWDLTTLGTICVDGGIQTGPFGSQLHAYDYVKEGIPVVMPKDINGGRIKRDSISKISYQKAKEIQKHKLKAGDIIWGRRGEIGRYALITQAEEGWVCGTGCMRSRLSKDVSPDFIGYLISKKQSIQWLNANAVGQTMLNLNTEILSQLPLILPKDQKEQKKIAEILGTWDQGIELLEKLIGEKQKLKKSLMQQLLTGKIRFKEFKGQKWREYPIHQVVETIFSNVDKKTHKDETSVLLCNYTDVYKNQYITKDLPFMQATAKKIEISKFTLKLHDVIITKDSETPNDIANPAVVIEPLKNVLCGYHLAILRPKPDIISGIFLAQMLMLQNIRHKFTRIANGATRYGLGVNDIKKIHLCIPDIKEQQKIASALNAADQEIEILQKQLSLLKKQKKGLMQKLLTGKIRVNL